jgi:hypothetical protein
VAERQCADVRADLAEAALDLLDEPARSDALVHVAGCAECRAELDDLVRTADRLLAWAPEAEPPPGFEQRVLARIDAAARVAAPDLLLAGSLPMPARAARPLRGRPWLALVAAGGALAAGVAVGVIVGDGGGDHRVAALAAVGIDRLDVAELRNDEGESVGSMVVARDGAPVMLLRLNQVRVGVAYRCEIALANGQVVDVGEWAPAHEHDYGWSASLPELGAAPVEARVLRPDGSVWATGTLG